MSDEPATAESEAILGELLVLRCRRSDADAWRQLVRLYERRLLYYLRRLLGSERDAWDVLQQTWLGVFRQIGSLQNPRALRPWLYRIAHNQAMTFRRRHGAEAPTQSMGSHRVDDLDELAAKPDDESEWSVDAAEQIHQGLSELSVDHREVLTLFFLEQIGVEEIAQVLGLPPGTVKSRLHYAKRALKDVLSRSESL